MGATGQDPGLDRPLYRRALPLAPAHKQELLGKFTTVIRATVKGNLLVAAVWQGLVLMAWGVLVIGLIDNLLRPLLVGKDTGMPDYVVLITTLGDMAVFGINGFVIGPAIAAMFIAVWHIYDTTQAGAKR